MADSVPTEPMIGLLLRIAHQHYTQEVDDALGRAGFGDLRPPHANVFPFVPESGISTSELARLAHVRKQTMGQAVDELTRLGYVERRANPADRRSQLVFLTERGRSVRPVTHAAAARVEQHWARLTGPDDLEQLRALLLRLLTELGGWPRLRGDRPG